MGSAATTVGSATDAGQRMTEHLEVEDLLDSMRAAWVRAAGTLTGTPDLGVWLERRIEDLRSVGRLDKAAVTSVLDEVSGAMRAAGRHDIDTELNRRLLRAVYEFLLGVDACRERSAAGLPAVDAPDAPADPVTDDAVPPNPAVASAELVPAAVIRLPNPAPAAPPLPPDPRSFPSLRSPAPVDRAAAEHRPVPGVAAASLGVQCDRLLKAGRHAEAAALLTAAVQQGGVESLGTIALAAGDHCRAATKYRASADCYLAAWNADRLDEAPLWRLAELALFTGEPELAVSYLERLVGVLQWRGDLRGAARVYRKMTILAPDRDDLKQLLRRAQSTTIGGAL